MSDLFTARQRTTIARLRADGILDSHEGELFPVEDGYDVRFAQVPAVWVSPDGRWNEEPHVVETDFGPVCCN